MEENNFIEAVQERDVDLLLMEEFHSSELFRKWFLNKLGFEKENSSKFIGAWHSISHSDLGESDLIVKFKLKNKAYLFLIENKIDANFQPRQDKRYVLRGEKYTKEKCCDAFSTVLFAPKEYLEGVPEDITFDFIISYEDLKEFFDKPGERNKYKSDFIQASIEKARRGWKAIENIPVTSFWKEYWKLAKIDYSELEMKEPETKPLKSTWVYFNPPQMGKGVSLVHKTEKGFTDLQIRGKADEFDDFKNRLKEFFIEGMSLQKAGKSLVIRINVPKIKMSEIFNSQKDKLLESLVQLKNMLYWFEKYKSLLE